MFLEKVVAAEALLSFSESSLDFSVLLLFVFLLCECAATRFTLERPANALDARTASGARRPPWVE